MNTLNRRDFVMGSTALGLVMAARAHAPDEYFLIDSQNPKVTGYRDAVRSYIDYLHQMA